MSNNVLPDPLNVNVVSPDPLPTDPVSKDFLVDVAFDLITGVSAIGILAEDMNSNPNESVISDGISGRYIWQSTAVPLEILSDNVNDTSAGTGVRTVFVIGLDDDYETITETVTMNGLTPANLVNSYMRVNMMISVTVGDTGSNEGLIILKRQANPAVQRSMSPFANRSLDGIYTVPAGKTAYLMQHTASCNKGNDAISSFYRRAEGGVFRRLAGIPLYQNHFNKVFEVFPSIPEKEDIELTSVSTNPSTTVFTTQQLLLRDN